MAIKIIAQQSLKWVHIDRIDDEALLYLREHHNFHELDIEDIRHSESQTPKVDAYKNYVFVILQIPHWEGTTKTILPLEVACFVGHDFLITIQQTKGKEMKRFFYRCMKNRKTKKEWMSGSSGFLLYHVLDAMFYDSRTILNNIGRQISKLENQIFAGAQDTRVVKELALHRRNVLSCRRIIDPQRYVIANLSHMRKPFIEESMSVYFDNVVDYLNKLWAILETYKDTVDGLHVTVESLMTQRTNKVVSTLTAISVGLLPLTLLSGIYGMNIVGLPFAEHPGAVWAMFASLSLVIVLFILWMRKKNWL